MSMNDPKDPDGFSELCKAFLLLKDEAECRSFLQKTPLFVPHARIAENARALGLSNILLTDAADAGILAGLVAYNWPA